MKLFFAENFNTQIDGIVINTDGSTTPQYVSQIILKFTEEFTKDDCTCTPCPIPTPGYSLSATAINELFLKHIGNDWFYKSLVPCGNVVPDLLLPPFYVSFDPSLENMAMYIYTIMAPIYKAEINAKLVSVAVITNLFEAIFEA